MTPNPDACPTPVPAPGRPAAVPGAWAALVLLVCMNLFNYIDRQVLAAVEPEVRRVLLAPDDPNQKTKMGLLSTAFLVSYMLIAPLFGWLAERYPRWKLIAVGVLLWSLATGASGLAITFAMMLLTRCFVGIGEGAYGPVAPTLLSDFYPVSVRGRVLAVFYAAIPVGGALGYALGGQMAAWSPERESWRWGFYWVVVPGLVLAVWSLLMREPRRGGADAVAETRQRPRLADYAVLLRTPSYVLNTAGMTAMTFAIGALAFWMSDYLKVHKVPAFAGIEPVTFFGGLTALAGLLATLVGGWVGDALRSRLRGAYFWVSGLGLLMSVPALWMFLRTDFPYAWIHVFLAVFFLFFNTGPTNTVLANVTHPSIRASGFALNILIIHALGDAISPAVVGAIADRSSLTVGFQVVALFMFLGGVFWIWGARYLERDTAMALRR